MTTDLNALCTCGHLLRAHTVGAPCTCIGIWLTKDEGDRRMDESRCACKKFERTS